MASDNALCESFYATLECEPLDRRRFPTQVEARMAVFNFIDGWYNPHRRVQIMSRRSAMNNGTQSSPSAKAVHPPRNRGHCAIGIHVAHAPLRGSACCLTTPAPRSRMLKGARQSGTILYADRSGALSPTSAGIESVSDGRELLNPTVGTPISPIGAHHKGTGRAMSELMYG